MDSNPSRMKPAILNQTCKAPRVHFQITWVISLTRWPLSRRSVLQEENNHEYQSTLWGRAGINVKISYLHPALKIYILLKVLETHLLRAMPIMCLSLFQGQNCNFGSSRSMGFFLKTDFPFSRGHGQEGLMMHGDRVTGQKIIIKNSWGNAVGLGRDLGGHWVHLCSCLLTGEAHQ